MRLAPGAAVLALLFAAAPADAATRVLLGRSVEGRPISAVRVGDPDAARTALVVGQIHGDEPAGRRVAALLRARKDIRGVDLWVVDSVNPDGARRGRRQNARGVDLNRNWPVRWKKTARGGRYYGGPRPLSEPESRAIEKLAQRIKPDVSIWYHQPYGAVLIGCTGSFPVQRRYAELARFPLQRCTGDPLPGTAIRWENATFKGTTAFVVEFGAGRPSNAAIERHARAALIVARFGAGT
jgi:murein peptide amidase A